MLWFVFVLLNDPTTTDCQIREEAKIIKAITEDHVFILVYHRLTPCALDTGALEV